MWNTCTRLYGHLVQFMHRIIDTVHMYMYNSMPHITLNGMCETRIRKHVWYDPSRSVHALFCMYNVQYTVRLRSWIRSFSRLKRRFFLNKQACIIPIVKIPKKIKRFHWQCVSGLESYFSRKGKSETHNCNHEHASRSLGEIYKTPMNIPHSHGLWAASYPLL